MKKLSKKTSNTAISAMCAALSFVLLFFGTFLGVFDMSAVALGGIISMFLVREAGVGFAVLSAAVCTTLSLILLPDKTVGALYLMAGGLYPIVKPLCEQLHGKVLQWTVKVIFFEVTIAVYLLLLRLFMPNEADGFLIPVAVAMGTACLVLYDILLTRFMIIYEVRFRRKRK